MSSQPVPIKQLLKTRFKHRLANVSICLVCCCFRICLSDAAKGPVNTNIVTLSMRETTIRNGKRVYVRNTIGNLSGRFTSYLRLFGEDIREAFGVVLR